MGVHTFVGLLDSRPLTDRVEWSRIAAASWGPRTQLTKVYGQALAVAQASIPLLSLTPCAQRYECRPLGINIDVDGKRLVKSWFLQDARVEKEAGTYTGGYIGEKWWGCGGFLHLICRCCGACLPWVRHASVVGDNQTGFLPKLH